VMIGAAEERNSWERRLTWEDAIVAEVHRVRKKLATDFAFDIGACFADLRRRQGALAERLVLQKKEAEPKAKADPGRDSPSGSNG